ncbi:DEAD/DEAH box helicase [Deinococcus yunweiensis]|uniref:DEAD/DEAH box helicase n=1 Tax=Deinococcus yunweiensis TaxID=367282 RepID=UPI00398F005E
MTPDPFARLAPFIQEYIWREGWSEIRAVQAAACAAILDTDDHVLITSGTASGKTEAALLPILTAMHHDPPQSIGALYIGPLKALINDQFYRLEGLLEASCVPVSAWHGDVSASRKARTLREARGVLQITPESLEGLLLRRGTSLRHLFGDLRFVVIDEAHAFMADERGRQVQCLLDRLAWVTAAPPRRVGLSATLGDVSQAQAWLRGRTSRAVQVVADSGGHRRIRLALDHFTQTPLSADDGEPGTDDDATPLSRAPGLYDHLYVHTQGRKSLVFQSSRQGVEETVQSLRELAEQRGGRDIYHVHHGSVAAAYRQDAEAAMREAGTPACTVATVTLELGIDLGQLERVLQIGPPASVSSFVQRLGRTGRRGEPGEMLFYVLESELDDTRPPHDRVPWALLRAIATVELYVGERWVEPARTPQLPTSLLVHQSLGMLEQYGEQHPRELAERVLGLTPFSHVTHDQYRDLLRGLIASDHLQRTDEGGLILGLAGGALVHDWHFLAVFQDEPEYAVFSGTSQIGTIGAPPDVGRVFPLIGRAWRVLSVDDGRRQVFVRRERGRNQGIWLGGGDFEVHDRVVTAMREILASENDYTYLQPAARERLQAGRELARASGLLTGCVHPLSGHQLLLTPWRGTHVQGSLLTVLNHIGVPTVREAGFALGLRGDAAELREMLGAVPDEETIRAGLRDAHLARPHQGGPGKFDRLVAPGLLADARITDALDIPGALAELRVINDALLQVT